MKRFLLATFLLLFVAVFASCEGAGEIYGSITEQDYETHLRDSEDNNIPLETWTETVSMEMYNEMGRGHILQRLSEHTHVEIITILSWLDFITNEQFQIVRDYLGIEPGGFDDQIFLKYLMEDMTRHYLVHYDRIPFEEMPNNPRRILTRMYEAWALAHFEYTTNIVGSVPTRYVRELEREVYDWR